MGLLNIVRRMALREKLSTREIARRTGMSRNTISIPSGRQSEVDELAVLVHGTPELAPLATDPGAGLVSARQRIAQQCPGRGCASSARASFHDDKRASRSRGRTSSPSKRRRPVHGDAALRKKIADVPAGKRKPAVPSRRKQDNVRWDPMAPERNATHASPPSLLCPTSVSDLEPQRCDSSVQAVFDGQTRQERPCELPLTGPPINEPADYWT